MLIRIRSIQWPPNESQIAYPQYCQVVSMADARKMVKVGARCYTEILLENGTDRKITYFNSPNKAIKEREKTNSTGRIWIENPEAKDIAHIVDKGQKLL